MTETTTNQTHRRDFLKTAAVMDQRILIAQSTEKHAAYDGGINV